MAAPAVLPATALAAQNEEQNQTAPATVPSLKTVEEYDTLIRKLGDTREVSDKIGNGTLDQNGKLLLMQRYLVNEREVFRTRRMGERIGRQRDVPAVAPHRTPDARTLRNRR